MQLLSLAFFYLSTSIALNLADNNALSSYDVKDIVSHQEKKTFKSNYFYNHLETENGYSFVLEGYKFYNHLGKEVELSISPIFKNVIDIMSCENHKYEHLKNGYLGSFNILFKFIALLVSLIAGGYIFYERCKIPFGDLIFLILFPAFIFMIAFVLFH